MSALTRHVLDPEQITAAVQRSIVRHQEFCERSVTEYRTWIQERDGLIAEGKAHRQGRWTYEELIEQAETFCADAIETERQHYARVRVVEDPASNAEKPFYLVYGDLPDEGPSRTGGFETLEAATGWFMNLGR